MEIFGTILSSVLAFYYISNGYVLSNRFNLFIGIGFLVNSLIDMVHVIASLTTLYDYLFLNYFMPHTWIAGKFFLSLLIMIAVIKFPYLVKKEDVMQYKKSNLHKYYKNLQNLNDRKSKTQNNVEKSSYLILISGLIIFSLIVSLGSILVVFPFSVLNDFPIQRTYELVPLILFLIGLFYFYKNNIYEEKDVLYISLLLFILINIFGQIIMSFSLNFHDTAHNVAHVLKDASYLIAIFGISTNCE